jgi:hypothetical protein
MGEILTTYMATKIECSTIPVKGAQKRNPEA